MNHDGFAEIVLEDMAEQLRARGVDSIMTPSKKTLMMSRRGTSAYLRITDDLKSVRALHGKSGVACTVDFHLCQPDYADLVVQYVLKLTDGRRGVE